MHQIILFTFISDPCRGALVYCQATLATLNKSALSKNMYLVLAISLLTFPRRACFQQSAPTHGQTSVDTTAVLYQDVPVLRVSFDCENTVAPQANTVKVFFLVCVILIRNGLCDFQLLNQTFREPLEILLMSHV